MSIKLDTVAQWILRDTKENTHEAIARRPSIGIRETFLAMFPSVIKHKLISYLGEKKTFALSDLPLDYSSMPLPLTLSTT